MTLSVKRMIVATLTALALPMASMAEDGARDLRRAPPPPADPSAPYCLPGQNFPGENLPHGLLFEGHGRVLHLCRNARDSNRLRVLVNPARVPGLRYRTTSPAVTLYIPERITRPTSHDGWLQQQLARYPDLVATKRLGGALYDIYQDTTPGMSDAELKELRAGLEAEGSGMSPELWKHFRTRQETIRSDPNSPPYGNLYVYRPEGDHPPLPPHYVHCNAEPKNLAEDGMTTCYIHTAYHGFLLRRVLYGGGPLPRPVPHDLFPAYVEDMMHLLRTADITDDPERQACIRAGRAWRNDQCEAP